MRRFPVKWIVVPVVILAIVGVGYWGVKALSNEDKTTYVMAVKEITRGDIEVVVRGWGQLMASEEQDAIAGASGIVKEVFFSDGQQVTKGQVLATIDPGPLELKILQAEASLESLRIELAKAFGVSPDQVGQVDPQAALTLKAPISGRISGLNASAGTELGAGSVVCTIVDDQRLVINLKLPKPLFDLIKVGTKTGFRPDRFSGEQPGVVTRADPTPIAGADAYFYDVAVEITNPGLLRVGDEGLLIFYGTEEFQQRATVASFGSEEVVTLPFRGRVKRLLVTEGTYVEAGNVILELEQGIALYDAMSKQAAYKEQLAELEGLRAQLQNLEIVSPIDGVCMGVNIKPGMQIGMGTSVTRVSNYTNLNLMLRVDEIDIPKVEVGQTANILVWGRDGQQTVQGQVTQLGAAGNPGDGYASFNITIALDNPGFLRPWMGAEAHIFVSKKSDVILCPIEALYKENDVWYVDLKDGKNRKPVQVEVGSMNDMYAEIISGLEPGQEVVIGMTREDPNNPGGGMKPIMY